MVADYSIRLRILKARSAGRSTRTDSVADYSIRLRILKGVMYLLNLSISNGCRLLDPIADTERKFSLNDYEMLRCCRLLDPIADTERATGSTLWRGPQLVADYSIRLRILKEVTNASDRALHGQLVADYSIRLRILKD